jgi:hypothetical protein
MSSTCARNSEYRKKMFKLFSHSIRKCLKICHGCFPPTTANTWTTWCRVFLEKLTATQQTQNSLLTRTKRLTKATHQVLLWTTLTKSISSHHIFSRLNLALPLATSMSSISQRLLHIWQFSWFDHQSTNYSILHYACYDFSVTSSLPGPNTISLYFPPNGKRPCLFRTCRIILLGVFIFAFLNIRQENMSLKTKWWQLLPDFNVLATFSNMV